MLLLAFFQYQSIILNLYEVIATDVKVKLKYHFWEIVLGETSGLM